MRAVFLPDGTGRAFVRHGRRDSILDIETPRGSIFTMPLTTPRELFVHELSDAMSAEQQILKMLPELQNEVLNHEVQEALKTHEQETQQQIRNIQEVFRQLGETPEATTCYAVKGLDEEHKALLKEQPSPEILEMANLSAASKTEHYEMAMYTGLVQLAKDLGENEAAQLLQDNLDQEKEMAVRVETLARELGKLQTQHMAMAASGGRR
jgi:ferritin-like metal-binding protein YciE